MRASNVPARLLGYVLMLLICISTGMAYGQSAPLHDSVCYAMRATCINPDDSKPAGEDRYFIRIDINDISRSEEDFDVSVNGRSILQYHVDSTMVPVTQIIGPFRHSGTGRDYMTISLQSLITGAADEILVPEVVCGYQTNLGLNQPGYFCDGFDGFILAQSKPLEVSNTDAPFQRFLYVLTDDTGEIVDKNYTGLFDDLIDLETYTMHAYAVLISEADMLYDQFVVGQNIADASGPACGYAHCGDYDVYVRCSGFDVALTKTHAREDLYRLGDTVEYLITIVNEGSLTAYNVTVRDEYPDQLIYLPDRNNTQWNENGESLPIDSIAAGDSVVLSIFFEIDRRTPVTELINKAEIILATEDPDDTISAIDEDSEPDNDDGDEDDQDEVPISIFENVCQVTFSMDIDNDPVCDDSPIRIYPVLHMATRPIRYTWYKDGVEISSDSMIYIENPVASDYGTYEILVQDFNNCESRMSVSIQSITDERPSCINSVNLSISDDCSLDIYPSMMTLVNIPGIDDFDIMVMDKEGNPIDLSDLTGVDITGPLEVKIINPCNGQVMCWGNVNIEYKRTPVYELYQGDAYTAMCAQVSGDDPSDIIARYHAYIDDEVILSADDYRSEMSASSCPIGWEVVATDIFIDNNDPDCGRQLVGRVYTAQSGPRSVTLDTALLYIEKINVDQVLFPSDVSSADCGSSVSPDFIESYPSVVTLGDTILLNKENFTKASDRLCNLVVSYTDQDWQHGCSYGANRVMRSWVVTNWCDNTYSQHAQYIYKMDDKAPDLTLIKDTAVVDLELGQCHGDIDIRDVLRASDNCDASPIISVKDHDMNGYMLRDMSTGMHAMTAVATDECGNRTEKTIYVDVRESTPPVPIITEALALSYSVDASNVVRAIDFDQGSNDNGCGSVRLLIARASEVDRIERAGGVLGTFELDNPCDESMDAEDENQDGELTIDEIFRPEIKLCCADLDATVPVIIRVVDQSGNHEDVRATVRVDYKGVRESCDDGDDCTINDEMIPGCGCQGELDTRDLDQDFIYDCIDDEFIFCLEGRTVSITRDEISDHIDRGAVPGSCDALPVMASIGGAVYTRDTQYVEDVQVTLSSGRQDMTDRGGQYAFSDNEMMSRYVLNPYKNDDVLNGVSISDLVDLQQFILGLSDLGTYQRLAADINGDGVVSIKDAVLLRQVLLGQEADFGDNTSWRFIPVYEEVDMAAIDERIIIDTLMESSMHNDWWAIKIGDLTGDVITTAAKANTRSDENATLVTQDRRVEQGEEISVQISLDGMASLSSLQLSMLLSEFDFLGVRSRGVRVTPVDFRYAPLDLELRFAITDRSILDMQSGLFSISLRARRSGLLSHLFSIDGGGIEDLAYDSDAVAHALSLTFVESDEQTQDLGFKLYQNQPNPFSDRTMIAFDLPADDQVTLTIYTPSGAQLWQSTDSYGVGRHEVSITRDEIGDYKGMLYYSVSTNAGYDAIRSMVVVDK